MKRRLGDFTGRIGDSLDIPRDLSYRESVLTLTGSREVFIENYKCIRKYQDTCILVLSKENKIQIEGTRLGYDKDQYIDASLKDENGKAYAYRDAAGNYYELKFGLRY